MDFEVKIFYKGNEAFYQICKEGPGVYSAELLHPVGGRQKLSVKDITLIRGIRYWAGSSDDTLLHHTLGRAIEAHLAKYLSKEVQSR